MEPPPKIQISNGTGALGTTSGFCEPVFGHGAAIGKVGVEKFGNEAAPDRRELTKRWSCRDKDAGFYDD